MIDIEVSCLLKFSIIKLNELKQELYAYVETGNEMK